MYRYGYGNLVEAQDVLYSLSLPDGLCGDCGPCPVKCPNRWNISDRVCDIARLREIPINSIA